MAQSRALARSGASLRGSRDSAREGLPRGDRTRDYHARRLLWRAAGDHAGAHVVRLRRDRGIPHRLRLRAPVEEYLGSGSRLRERRIKDKLFAKGVSREDVRKGAEELGGPL